MDEETNMNKLIKQIIESRYNFNIDIEPTTSTNDDHTSLSKSVYTQKSQKDALEQDAFIDLDLPSGTLWAKHNIGSKPIMKQTEENWYDAPKSWYGDYFAFGETEPKDVYTYATYKWIIDENSYKKSEFMKKYYYPGWEYKHIDLCDDAAYVNSNGRLVMPTKEQYEELINCCNVERKMHYMDIGGLHGRLFTSKSNGNQLFFPEADIKTNIEHEDFNLHQNYCNICYYWTASLYSCDGGNTCSPEALMISNGSGSNYMFISSECHANGLPVRGVKNFH